MFRKDFNSTVDLNVDDTPLIEQVIGQDDTIDAVKNAMANKRNIILLGEPGVGKSMIVNAVFDDVNNKNEDFVPYTIMAAHNPKNTDKPIVGYKDGVVVSEHIVETKKKTRKIPMLVWELLFLSGVMFTMQHFARLESANLMASLAVFMVFAFIGLVAFLGYTLITNVTGNSPIMQQKQQMETQILYECKKRPLLKTSGSNVTRILGDIKHCPYGGKPPIGTPAHKRIILGAIHEAHKGVLYVDEIKTMPLSVQDYILTAMQDGSLSISGKNTMSSGASVETNPIPCDFTLVMSGNMDDISGLRAPLLDRVDYKIVLHSDMDNTIENRSKMLRFICNEIKKNKIKHLTYDACCEIVRVAQTMSGSKDKLSLRLRHLASILKLANDAAKGDVITGADIKTVVDTGLDNIHKQHALTFIERMKKYKLIEPNTESKIGVVHGLAVYGASGLGDVTKIVTHIDAGCGKGKIEVLNNKTDMVKQSAVVAGVLMKKYADEGKLLHNDVCDYKSSNIYVQFAQTHSKLDGDSATAAMGLSIMSAYLKIPLKQDFCITGSLDLQGNITAIGGVNAKINAAKALGFKKVFVPTTNYDDVLDKYLECEGFKVIPVNKFEELLPQVFDKEILNSTVNECAAIA